MKLPVFTACAVAALLASPAALARETPAVEVPLFQTPAAAHAPAHWSGEQSGEQVPASTLAEQLPTASSKDQQQVPSTDVAPPVPDEEGEEDFSMGDIPVVETVELTIDQAKRALDAYALVSNKYKDAELENFENLQDFVEQAPQGRAFEADIKAAGFATVNEWNVAVTTLSFALANINDDQTADILQQIEELKSDTEMAQDMRERMMAALKAMIPSENNKSVIAELQKDPVYAEKLKQLELEEVE